MGSIGIEFWGSIGIDHQQGPGIGIEVGPIGCIGIGIEFEKVVLSVSGHQVDAAYKFSFGKACKNVDFLTCEFHRTLKRTATKKHWVAAVCLLTYCHFFDKVTLRLHPKLVDPQAYFFLEILKSKHSLLSLFFAIIRKRPVCFCQQKRVNGRVCQYPIVTLFISAPSLKQNS